MRNVFYVWSLHNHHLIPLMIWWLAGTRLLFSLRLCWKRVKRGRAKEAHQLLFSPKNPEKLVSCIPTSLRLINIEEKFHFQNTSLSLFLCILRVYLHTPSFTHKVPVQKKTAGVLVEGKKRRNHLEPLSLCIFHHVSEKREDNKKQLLYVCSWVCISHQRKDKKIPRNMIIKALSSSQLWTVSQWTVENNIGVNTL